MINPQIFCHYRSKKNDSAHFRLFLTATRVERDLDENESRMKIPNEVKDSRKMLNTL